MNKNKQPTPVFEVVFEPEIENDNQFSVKGRVFETIHLGDCLYLSSGIDPAGVEVKFEVVEIMTYGFLFDEISEGMTAKITLQGNLADLPDTFERAHLYR